MNDFETKADLINWFDERWDRAQVELLVNHGVYSSLGRIWNAILDKGWLSATYNGNAWVTRTGKVWCCNWGTHEFLLGRMGVEAQDVEDFGWVRISTFNGYTRVQIRARPSAAQMRFLKREGLTGLLPLRRLLEPPPPVAGKAKFYD